MTTPSDVLQGVALLMETEFDTLDRRPVRRPMPA